MKGRPTYTFYAHVRFLLFSLFLLTREKKSGKKRALKKGKDADWKHDLNFFFRPFF